MIAARRAKIRSAESTRANRFVAILVAFAQILAIEAAGHSGSRPDYQVPDAPTSIRATSVTPDLTGERAPVLSAAARLHRFTSEHPAASTSRAVIRSATDCVRLHDSPFDEFRSIAVASHANRGPPSHHLS